MTLRLGTRASPLALAQANLVAGEILRTLGQVVDLTPLRAHGDDPRVPLGAQPRAFVSTLRDALVADEVDLVVHSLKDLPTDEQPGVTLAAVPERADPRDALCSRHGAQLATLRPGSIIGTSSPRRTAALERQRPDLTVIPIRGNIDTRLALLRDARVDAVVLAVAGLIRLGRGDAITEVLEPGVMTPAPGQGALAIECRTEPLADVLAALDHTPSRLAVTAERAVLRALGADCATAAGALATWAGAVLTLTGCLTDAASRHTTGAVAAQVTSRAGAEALGVKLASRLTGRA
ncbi:MAG: hydroxymethylbilane synthase [Candidatus Phosphoribacter sp.]